MMRKGQKMSLESRKKLSDSVKLQWQRKTEYEKQKWISMISKNNKGHIETKEARQNKSNWWKQKHIQKWASDRYIGDKNPLYGKHHSEKSKLQMRKSAIKRITKNKFQNKKFGPNIGKNETKILNTIEQKLNIKLTRQYEILGYFIDGYDEINNIVYEVYERYHNVPKQKKLDTIREDNIIKKLNCAFVKIIDC